MPSRKVATGDCIVSIASDSGFKPDTIWLHPDNAALRQQRKSPVILKRSDAVFVPERAVKTEQAATENTHRFRRVGLLAHLKVCLLYGSQPLANRTYVLTGDSTASEGTTDDSGLLEEPISPLVKTATIELEDESFELLIGDLDPVETLRGAQARLHNLGFDCGEVDDVMGPLTKDALELFQETYELEISGELDEPTQEKLSELHDNLPQTIAGAGDSEFTPRSCAKKVPSVHHVARSTKGFEQVNVIDTAGVLMFSV